MKLTIQFVTGHKVEFNNPDEITPTDRTLEVQIPDTMMAIPMDRILYWRIDV